MPAKKGNTKKRANSQKRVKENTQGKRQAISVVLFGISLFLLFMVIIPGENLWKVGHDFLFGLFGWVTFFAPVLMIFTSFLFAAQKLEGKALAKIIEIAVLLLLVGAAVDIFIPNVEGISFGEHITAAYHSGAALRGAGFFGALIGEPIVMAFGTAGAIVTIIILLLVFILLTTGTSIIALFRTVSRPIKKIEETVENSFQEKAEREKIPVSNIDIRVPDNGAKAKPRPTPNEMQQRVIDTYRGNDSAEAAVEAEQTELPIDAEVPSVDEALEAAKKEAAKTKKIIEETKAEVEAASVESIEMVGDSYKYPPLDLLTKDEFSNQGSIEAEMESTAERLVEVLRSFGVETRVVDISRGPTVTRYELQPSAGVKISKITNLADDIALNLAAAGVRIEAPIPGKAAVGIEIPNRTGKVVRVRDLLESPVFQNSKSKLTVALC